MSKALKQKPMIRPEFHFVLNMLAVGLHQGNQPLLEETIAFALGKTFREMAKVGLYYGVRQP